MPPPTAIAVAIGGGGGVASLRRGRLLPQPGAARRCRRDAEPAEPLPGRGRRRAAVRRHPRARQPARARLGRRSRDARRTADFQTTPNGELRGLRSDSTLAGRRAGGIASVYLFDAAARPARAASSCDPPAPPKRTSPGTRNWPRTGSNLLDDGGLFFTTRAQLLLNDTNGRRDVYEWAEGGPQLICSGSGPFDSALLERLGRRHRRLLLHPRHPGAERRSHRRADEDLRRAGGRRLLRAAA